MIIELTNYISKISKQFPLKDFVKPARGLHIMLEVKDGQVKIYRAELYQPQNEKEEDYSNFLREECLPKEIFINHINSDKAIADKKIHSANPFALKIRKKSFDEEWEKWFPEKELAKKEKKGDDAAKQEIEEIKRLKKEISEKEKNIKNLKGEDKKSVQKIILKEKITNTASYISEVIKNYFEAAERKCLTHYQNNEEEQVAKCFQNYCIEYLPQLIQDLEYDILQLKKDENIIVLLKNISQERYEEENKKYFAENIFNVKTYTYRLKDQDYGLSDYLNTGADKKLYLKHLTTPFFVNNRISQQQGLLLNQFDAYRREGAFKANPLLIFIDNEELNSEVIDIVKREGNQISFHQLIHILFEHKKEDLGNYYLIYFSGGDIKDVDFVSSFQYNLKLEVKQVIPFVQAEKHLHIKNIFQFEQEIVQSIFSNQLVQKRRDGSIAFKYFDDIDNNPKYITDVQWQLVMEYRKAFYDFIFKSRRQAITSTAFHDIMRQGILDDIRHDEIQNEQHIKKTNDIRKKLNIWFSLWNFFNNNSSENDLTMANKIIEHQTRIRTVRDNANVHIQTDDEFAFATGQIIYYLLYQSKAGNKTHALLEPFLQKTDAGELKKAIANTFNAYKHEINFGKGRFEKLCSEIMDYALDGNLKELMPQLLAGYFSTSLIYEKTETK